MLEVENLTVEFNTGKGWAPAVTDVSFSVGKGQTLGVVGESGSGKSVTCHSILRLLPTSRVPAGQIRFFDQDILTMSSTQLRQTRGGDIGMIFQDAIASLNPTATIGRQLAEVVQAHVGSSRKDAMKRAAELLEMVGIGQAGQRVSQYPHEFSGGMKQRVMIALALAGNPRMLIADEPTTALDVTIQAQILDLLKRLARETDLGVLFVTHDLGAVAELCDDVVVMYAGQVVESAPIEKVMKAPSHPYTSALMRARPSVSGDGELYIIPGAPPTGVDPARGCAFAPRCDRVIDACHQEIPLETAEDGTQVRCIRPHNFAPAVAHG